MITSRSISAKRWADAREALVFYFSRRWLREDAEDLAHETLATIWNHKTYQIEREDDFPKVCYGFAHNVMRKHYREESKNRSTELTGQTVPRNEHSRTKLLPAELAVYLSEVEGIAASELEDQDWEMIRLTAFGDKPVKAAEGDKREENRLRVRISRARQRLRDLTGWKDSSL